MRVCCFLALGSKFGVGTKAGAIGVGCESEVSSGKHAGCYSDFGAIVISRPAARNVRY